jgi:hypothetical protein
MDTVSSVTHLPLQAQTSSPKSALVAFAHNLAAGLDAADKDFAKRLVLPKCGKNLSVTTVVL